MPQIEGQGLPTPGQEDLWGQTLRFVLGWIRTDRDDKFLPSIGKIGKQMHCLQQGKAAALGGQGRKLVPAYRLIYSPARWSGLYYPHPLRSLNSVLQA